MDLVERELLWGGGQLRGLLGLRGGEGRWEEETYVISITSSKWFAIAQNKSKNLPESVPE